MNLQRKTNYFNMYVGPNIKLISRKKMIYMNIGNVSLVKKRTLKKKNYSFDSLKNKTFTPCAY